MRILENMSNVFTRLKKTKGKKYHIKKFHHIHENHTGDRQKVWN